MLEQVAYYRSAYPDEAWHLFSPYWGSYMPINIEAGSSFDDNAQTLYRLVKKENDDLVQKAIANRPADGYCYSISRVGDSADYDYNIRVLP